MKYVSVVAIGLACSGAFASQPGQPLDCSDWVFLQPGLSCAPWVAPDFCAPDPNGPFCHPNLGSAALDNDRMQYAVRVIPGGAACCLSAGSCTPCTRFALVRFDGAAETMIAYLDERFNGHMGDDTMSETPTAVDFDRVGGRLLVWMTSFSTEGGVYPDARWAAAITGFTPLFDVLQSFTPQPTTLGFRVPFMPEGMGGADHFATYWGSLTHPIDFTQAHPLQCSYPSTPPKVGDYLTVADTVPTPAPGQAVYYITATTYQGQTRYGRKSSGGKLTGRDPAVLPGCSK
jgi:hypothetical protein